MIPRIALTILLFGSLPFLAGFDNEIIASFSGEMTWGGRFGSAVVGVGDVDGNGIHDFVVGDQDYEDPGLLNQGRAYLFLTFRDPLRFERITLPGPIDVGLYGKEISALGDLDGDGLADFSVTSENQRQVDIFFGRPAWPWIEKSALVAPPGVRTTHISALGDVNGDGEQDLLIEALFPGKVYIVSWPSVWDLEIAPTIDPNISGLGIVKLQRARVVGDVDVDGFPDFVLTGGRRVDGTNQRYAFLYRGQRIALHDMQPSAVLDLYPLTSLAFYDSEPAPDLDGDGRPEILVTEKVDGVQHLVALGYRGPGQWERTRTLEASNPARLGTGGIVPNFDFDGDGYWDILVVDGYTAPNLRVFRGPFPDDRIEGSSFVPSSRGLDPLFGASSIANVGDIDGDGLEDLLVGTNEPIGTGSAYVLRGGATRALNIDVTRTENEGNGQVVLRLSARIEGSPSPEPALLRSIELKFRAARYPYTDVSDARITNADPWVVSTSTERKTLTVHLYSEDGVKVDDSASPLLHLLTRPVVRAGIPLELFDASATTVDGLPLWITADKRTFRKVTRPADELVASRPEGQISANPSPANPRTSFRIVAPEPGTVSLGVFDIRGRRVWKQTMEVAVPGEFDVLWSGIDVRGRHVASGVYTVRAVGRGWQATTRVVIVR